MQKVKCNFCGAEILSTDEKCTNCGAVNQNYVRTSADTPVETVSTPADIPVVDGQ